MIPKGIQAKISAYIEKHPELRLATQDIVLFEMEKVGEITAAEVEDAKKGSVFNFAVSGSETGLSVEHDNCVEVTKKTKIMRAEGIVQDICGIPLNYVKESGLGERLEEILSGLELEVNEENVINVLKFLGIIQETEPQTPTEDMAKEYFAEYILNQMDAIVEIYNQVANSDKSLWTMGTGLMLSLNDVYEQFAEKVNEVVGAPLLPEGDNSRSDLGALVNDFKQKINELRPYVKNIENHPELFEAKFKKLFGTEIKYETVLNYLEAVSVYQQADKKSQKNKKSEENQQLRAAQAELDKINPLTNLSQDIEGFSKGMNLVGGLADFGLTIALMYVSGGGAAITKSSQAVGNAWRFTVGNALKNVTSVKGVKVTEKAKFVAQEIAGILSSTSVNALYTSSFFNATKLMATLEDGKAEKAEADVLIESFKGLSNFTAIGGLLAGPLGMKASELTSKLFNSERSIASTIKIAIEGKGTTLDKVLKALSENSNAISKVVEFGTSFSINADYMAAADGMSFGEAMGSLAQMDAVSKLVVAMLGGKNVSFLTPQKVQQIKTNLAGYKVDFSVYKGKKVYEITDKAGVKARVENEQELFNFIVAKEMEFIEKDINQSSTTDVQNEPSGKEPYTSPEARLMGLSMTDDIMSTNTEGSTESVAARELRNAVLKSKLADESYDPAKFKLEAFQSMSRNYKGNLYSDEMLGYAKEFVECMPEGKSDDLLISTEYTIQTLLERLEFVPQKYRRTVVDATKQLLSNPNVRNGIVDKIIDACLEKQASENDYVFNKIAFEKINKLFTNRLQGYEYTNDYAYSLMVMELAKNAVYNEFDSNGNYLGKHFDNINWELSLLYAQSDTYHHTVHFTLEPDNITHEIDINSLPESVKSYIVEHANKTFLNIDYGKMTSEQIEEVKRLRKICFGDEYSDGKPYHAARCFIVEYLLKNTDLISSRWDGIDYYDSIGVTNDIASLRSALANRTSKRSSVPVEIFDKAQLTNILQDFGFFKVSNGTLIANPELNYKINDLRNLAGGDNIKNALSPNDIEIMYKMINIGDHKDFWTSLSPEEFIIMYERFKNLFDLKYPQFSIIGQYGEEFFDIIITELERPDITSNERYALGRFIGDEYDHINSSMENENSANEYYRKIGEDLHNLIDRHPVKTQTTMNRTERNIHRFDSVVLRDGTTLTEIINNPKKYADKIDEINKELRNMPVHNKRFMSATIGTDHNPMVGINWRLELEEGSHAIFRNTYTDINNGELEYIVRDNSNTTFQIEVEDCSTYKIFRLIGYVTTTRANALD